MTETGEYTVLFFNRKGSKLRDLTLVATSIMQARLIGSDLCKNPPEEYVVASSFRVDRVVYNSLDNEPNWR